MSEPFEIYFKLLVSFLPWKGVYCVRYQSFIRERGTKGIEGEGCPGRLDKSTWGQRRKAGGTQREWGAAWGRDAWRPRWKLLIISLHKSFTVMTKKSSRHAPPRPAIPRPTSPCFMWAAISLVYSHHPLCPVLPFFQPRPLSCPCW